MNERECCYVLVRINPGALEPYHYRCLNCPHERDSQWDDPLRHHRRCLVDSPCFMRGECVGQELKAIFDSINAKKPEGCNCEALASWMDRAGADACEQRKHELLPRLEANAHRLGWCQWFAAGGRALVAGYTSLESMFDQAIRRARTNAKAPNSITR